MEKYKLIFKKSVLKDLRSIPRKDVARIIRCIDNLMNDPRPPGSEKLSGQERYRIRQGLYRIIYEINDDVLMVVVVKVGHRKEVYRVLKNRA
jgi:mRNA interferase RelE/StbE